jgi:hypothetical protein
MYQKPNSVAIWDYYEMWKKLGIGDKLATKVKIRTEEF